MPSLGLPMVEGLTETSEDSEPLHVKLMALLSQRPAASRSGIADALALLEDAWSAEANSDVKERIAAGISMLRGGSMKDDE